MALLDLGIAQAGYKVTREMNGKTMIADNYRQLLLRACWKRIERYYNLQQAQGTLKLSSIDRKLKQFSTKQ